MRAFGLDGVTNVLTSKHRNVYQIFAFTTLTRPHILALIQQLNQDISTLQSDIATWQKLIQRGSERSHEMMQDSATTMTTAYEMVQHDVYVRMRNYIPHHGIS